MAQKLEDVRKAFDRAGVTVSEWSAANGFRREDVYAVLSGRTKGLRGQAHHIATALGLKPTSDLADLLGLHACDGPKGVRPSRTAGAKEAP